MRGTGATAGPMCYSGEPPIPYILFPSGGSNGTSARLSQRVRASVPVVPRTGRQGSLG